MSNLLMDVMVNVLASNGWLDTLGDPRPSLDASALELARLLFETSLDGSGITVVVLTNLDGCHVVDVLLGQNLLVLDGLDGGVVMVLVDLTVDGGLHILVAGLDNLLLDDSGSYLLVDGGIVMTSLGPIKLMSVQ